MAVDWTQLPAGLLSMIAKKLDLISDYRRFRSVCSPWRSAARPSDLPPQMPWLAIPSSLKNRDASTFSDTDTRSFFLPAGGKTRTLHLPEARSRLVYGSPHCWLLTIGLDLSVSLLNPLTRASVPLPSLLTGLPADDSLKVTIKGSLAFGAFNISFGGSPFVHLSARGSMVSGTELKDMHGGLISSTFLSSDPTSGADCVAMISFADLREIIFCRPGDTVWTVVDACTPGKVDNLIFHEGRIYAVDQVGNVAIITPAASEEPVSVPPVAAYDDDKYHYLYERYYLVGSCGEVMLVRKRGCKLNRHPAIENGRIEVYHLGSGEEPVWERVTSIGGKVLILDADHAASFPASVFPSCSGDCIYFTDGYDGGFCTYFGISKFNIRDGSTQRLTLYRDICEKAWEQATWFVPALC